jgi:hypothetical protein
MRICRIRVCTNFDKYNRLGVTESFLYTKITKKTLFEVRMAEKSSRKLVKRERCQLFLLRSRNIFEGVFGSHGRIFENFSKNKRNLSDTFSKVTISVTGKVQRTERIVKKFGKLFEKFSKMFHGSENIFENVRRKEQRERFGHVKLGIHEYFISNSDGALQKI